MKAAAYRYAESGGNIPTPLRALHYVDRFGVQAVYGRQLGVREMSHMLTSEAITKLYHARERAENWAAWAQKNPTGAELLAEAQLLAQETEE